MDGSQCHQRDQQHCRSDDQDANVSVSSDDDKTDEPDDEYSGELKGHAGVCGRQEHVDHLMDNALTALLMPNHGPSGCNTL